MQSRTLIDLERVEGWPPRLLAFLNAHHDLFYGWEVATGNRDPGAFDRAMYGLRDELNPYALTGWHCTRLTEGEITDVQSAGLSPPNASMLHRRIDRLVIEKHLTPELALRLKNCHQAADANRAGRVWFCFFAPRLAGEGGIGRFFRHWGGEALYNSHEDDPVTSPTLQAIGTPALIEADIPIDALAEHGGLTFKVVRRYLVHRGLKTRERLEHEDQLKQPLPPMLIRRVIRFPEPDFMSLTGCAHWRAPIGSSR